MSDQIQKIDLVGFGVIEKSESGNFEEDSESSPTGYFIRTDDISFIEETSDVVARIGVGFGIKYVLIGQGDSEVVNFVCKIQHPSLTNPESDVEYSETTEYKSNYLNEENFDFYEIESEWEAVSGKWVFNIVENGKVLLKHEFTLR